MTPATDLSAHANLLSDGLHRALAASGDSRFWLLLDPTIRPLASDEPLAQALAAAGADIKPLPAPHRGIDPGVMPRMTLLDSARATGSAALSLSIEEATAECQTGALMHGSGRRIGGWLQTTASGATLARHVARLMLQRRPDGRATLLRWTDPAALWVIWSTLDASQRAALLGPIVRYHLLDPAGRLIVLSTSELPSPSRIERMGNLALTDKQWRLFDAIGALNLALLAHGASSLAPERLNFAREDGLSALLRAQALGFADTHDLAAFACRAMAVHPRFDTHPLVAERLAKRQVGDCFTGLVDDLDADQWSRIALESDSVTRV